LHGFLNINKPRGITSFEVVKRIRRYFPRQRVGHLGTLDPMADGVLPLAVGQATRLTNLLLEGNKGYRAEMTLGAVADTQDAWGELTYVTADIDLELSELLAVLDMFRGEIEQVPPMYSAVNYQGQRLYKLARQGISVEVQPRRVTIYSLELVESHLEGPPYRVVLDVVCSKGTYIRTLCHDIGQALGCGAYLSGLTRYFSGPFRLEEAVALEEAERLVGQGDKSILLPFDFPLAHLPRVVLEDQNAIKKLRNGNTISVANLPAAALVRIYSPGNEVLVLGRPLVNPEGEMRLQPYKVFNFN